MTPKKRRPRAAAGPYGARPVKRRQRRTADELRAVSAAALEFLKQQRPATVRQVFYGLSVLGVVPKDETAYKAVGRLLGEMRLDGRVPFAWLTDHTRMVRKPRTFDGLTDYLDSAAQFYRRDLWKDQSSYVEIWLEKDALSGVVYSETWEFDVPLMVTRGYPSLSFLNSAAEVIDNQDKPTYLYYFGDFDPSGVDISRNVEERLREFSAGDIHFERVAVTPAQIRQWNLPTRPTKKRDSRARNFSGDSVELDAIPPAKLRALVRSCIERHIDAAELSRLRAVEAAERETLRGVSARLAGGGEYA